MRLEGASGRSAFNSWLAEPAANLAVFRIAVFAIILCSPETYSGVENAALAPALRVAPEGLGWFVRFVPITVGYALFASKLLWLGSVAALAGLFTRAAAATAALSGFYVFALAQLSGSVLHDMHLLWFAALLAVSPAGDALSLDRFISKDPPDVGRASAAYGAPLMASRILLGVIYLFPGFWKLAESGLAWALSDNLRNQMYWKWYEQGRVPPVRIDRFPALCKVGGALVVLFEFTFLPLVLSRRTRWLALAGGVTFHALTQAFLYIPFASLWASYVCLVNWRALWLRIRARTSARALREEVATFSRRAWWPLALGLVLGCAAFVQGARGAMQAWPFACYPTFQWLVPSMLPDIVLEAVRSDGTMVVLPDGPGAGGSRTQTEWAMVWRVAGSYGDPVTHDRLQAYVHRALGKDEVRRMAAGARRIRVHRGEYSVRPEDWSAPPVRSELLGVIDVAP